MVTISQMSITTISVVSISSSLGLGSGSWLGISGPLAIISVSVSMVGISYSMTITMTISMAVISTKTMAIHIHGGHSRHWHQLWLQPHRQQRRTDRGQQQPGGEERNELKILQNMKNIRITFLTFT